MAADEREKDEGEVTTAGVDGDRSSRSSPSTLRIVPPLTERPSKNDLIALRIGLAVLAIIFVWMCVMALHRPMTYSEMAETAPWPDMRLDINTATEAEFTVLPGIGPRLAERIVDDRKANGPFDSRSDLMRVPMIGPRTVERISPYVMVRPIDHHAANASE